MLNILPPRLRAVLFRVSERISMQTTPTSRAYWRTLLKLSTREKLFKSKSIWFDFVSGSLLHKRERHLKKIIWPIRVLCSPSMFRIIYRGKNFNSTEQKNWMRLFYLVNGWQQIQDANAGKSIGTQVEYRPTTTGCWTGTHTSAKRTRSLHQLMTALLYRFIFHLFKGRWSATGCACIGFRKEII